MGHGKEGGGRNLGEACHIYDLFISLAEDEIVSLSAHSIKSKNNYYGSNDNFVATLSFKNGFVGNLLYTSMGNSLVQKETADLYFDGKIIKLNDFKTMEVYGLRKEIKITNTQDKGLKR